MKHLLFCVLFFFTTLFAFPDILILFTYFQKNGTIICINSDAGDYLRQERRYFFRHDTELGWEYTKTVGDYDKEDIFIENARKKCDFYKDDTEKVLKEMKPLIIQEKQKLQKNLYILSGVLGGIVLLGIFILVHKRSASHQKKK